MIRARGTYLERIVADVRARLDAEAGAAVPAVRPGRRGASLVAAIRAASERGELGIVAEVKRRSPSVGAIAEGVDPAAQARAYAEAGAVGISVLTEPDHFGGSLEDLVTVGAAATGVAVLRKDFILEASQLEAARVSGADAVLLIAALHEEPELEALLAEADARGLEALVEVHDEHDLARALAAGARLVGINNRDLRSFIVDLAVTERLAPLVPDGCLVVAESGVGSSDDAARMRRAGAHAVLVGEHLMRSSAPAAALRALAEAGRR